MSTDLRDELKAFERDLASLVARFLRLYDRLETNVRPETRPAAPPRPMPREPGPLSGYQ